MVPVKGFMIYSSKFDCLRSYSGIGKFMIYITAASLIVWNLTLVLVSGSSGGSGGGGGESFDSVVTETKIQVMGNVLGSWKAFQLLPEVGNVDTHGWTSNRCDRWGWAEEVESIWGREISKRGTGSFLDLRSPLDVPLFSFHSMPQNPSSVRMQFV